MINFNKFKKYPDSSALYIETAAINYYTKGRNSTEQIKTSALFPAYQDIEPHIEVYGNPEQELTFQRFGNLFHKFTASYPGSDGAIKKYTAWLNPYNICSLREIIPGTTTVYFYNGKILTIAYGSVQALGMMINYKKDYEEKRRARNGTSPNK